MWCAHHHSQEIDGNTSSSLPLPLVPYWRLPSKGGLKNNPSTLSASFTRFWPGRPPLHEVLWHLIWLSLPRFFSQCFLHGSSKVLGRKLPINTQVIDFDLCNLVSMNPLRIIRGCRFTEGVGLRLWVLLKVFFFLKYHLPPHQDKICMHFQNLKKLWASSHLSNICFWCNPMLRKFWRFPVKELRALPGERKILLRFLTE